MTLTKLLLTAVQRFADDKAYQTALPERDLERMKQYWRARVEGWQEDWLAKPENAGATPKDAAAAWRTEQHSRWNTNYYTREASKTPSRGPRVEEELEAQEAEEAAVPFVQLGHLEWDLFLG